MRVQRARYSLVERTLGSGVLKQTATAKVTTAPKAMRQGNSIRGSHAGAQRSSVLTSDGIWMEKSPNVDMQPAKNRHHQEAANHCEEISCFAAPSLSQQTYQEHPEQRAVSISKDPSTMGMIRAFRTILA